MRPDLFHVFGYAVPSYGVMVAVGILAATGLALWLARHDGVTADFVLDAVFWSVVSGFLGARGLYLAVTWRETAADPVGSVFSGGGGVIAGGLLAGALAAAVVAQRHGVGLARAADLLAPAVALGQACGRIGCYLNGCCYGCLVPGWLRGVAVRYPRFGGPGAEPTGSYPYLDHLRNGFVSTGDAWSLPVVPVQLLEAAWCGLLAAGLTLLWWRRLRPGTVAVVYGVTYAAGRFALEFWRGDADRGVWMGLSLSQWLALVAVGCLGVVWRRMITVTPARHPPDARA
jgi:phosphatidylglycerol:prolipoprotein diacylglycerol transferase